MNIYFAREKLRTCSIFDLKLKVAYYARVSTEKAEQQGSMKHQKEYFEELIQSNSNWTFVGGYIDDGISGMHAEKRDNFQNMISDSESGKIDMIITKEISRFARNTLDSIKYTRELLSCGVCVWFQNDGINTIDEDSELRLTIMAGIAQDELRKLSSRIKFGHARSIKNGVVLGSRIYGYHKKDGKLTVVPKEAEMIRIIFNDYASGNTSTPKLEKKLWDLGYRNFKGGKINRDVIKNIIKNPKYKGYFCGNKVKVVDMFTKKQEFLPESEWVMFKDDGSRVPQIVDEEIWEKANYYMKTKSDIIKSHRTSFKGENLFTGKLFCAIDGAPYWLKCRYVRKKDDTSWVCSHRIKNGVDSCSSFPIKEYELKSMIADLINESSENIDEIISEYLSLLKKVFDGRENKGNELQKLQEQIEILKRKKEKILEYNLDGNISDQEFLERNTSYSEQMKNIEKRIEEMSPQEDNFKTVEKAFADISNMLKKFDKVQEGDINRQIVEELFDKIVVEPKPERQAIITFHLNTGELKTKQLYRTGSGSSYLPCTYPVVAAGSSATVVLDTCYLTLRQNNSKFYRKSCLVNEPVRVFEYECRLVI